MEKLSRLVIINGTSFYKSFQYVNYALSNNALTVRLLKDSTSETEDLLEESLHSTKPVLANSFIQPTGVTVAYKGKTLEIIAEAVFDYDVYPKEAKQPLSNILIYLCNNELKIDNYLLRTSLTHYRTPDYMNSLSGTTMCLAQVYFVNSDDVVSNSSMSLVKLNNVEIISNIDTSKFIEEDSASVSSRKSLRSRFQPKLRLDALSESVEEDGSISYRVSCYLNGEICTSANFVVHIEPVDGYVAHKRVSLINGEATFTATALGLKAGESMRIKVGLSHYSGLAECTVPVVAKEKQEEQTKTPEQLILEMQAASLSANQIKQDIKAYSEKLIASGLAKTLNEFTTLKEDTDALSESLSETAAQLVKNQEEQIKALQENYNTELRKLKDKLKEEVKSRLDELAEVRETFIDVVQKLQESQDDKASS